jgi:hypothetical protein
MKKIFIAIILFSTLFSCKQAVKEVVETSAEKVTKVFIKEAAEEAAEKSAKEATEKVTKEVVEGTLQKGTKELTQEGLEKATKEAAEKISKEASEKGLMASAKLALNRALISNRNQFVKSDNYLKWLKENPDALLFGKEKSGTILRENMKKIMGKDFDKFAGKTGFEAHHLIGVDSRFQSSNISQGILQKFGIDINDPMNGILLPSNSNSLLKGTIHKGGHTKAYHDEVARRLQNATSKEQCLQILDGIKEDLYKGKLSLYNELKKNTVTNSFKR